MFVGRCRCHCHCRCLLVVVIVVVMVVLVFGACVNSLVLEPFQEKHDVV